MSLWLRHVRQKFFFDITIEFSPISIVFFNLRCLQVKRKTAHVRMLLEITKDMISCLKMAEARISLVLGEKGDFEVDIDMANLNGPS